MLWPQDTSSERLCSTRTGESTTYVPDPQIKRNFCRTPFLWAVLNGDYVRVDEFLCAGACAYKLDDCGNPPIYYALRDWHANGFGSPNYGISFHSNRFKTMQLLVKAGAEVNMLDKHGWSLLSGAVCNGYYASARKLVQLSADVNNPRSTRESPLYQAVSYSRSLAFTGWLLEQGASIYAIHFDAAKKRGRRFLFLIVQKRVLCAHIAISAAISKQCNLPVLLTKELCNALLPHHNIITKHRQWNQLKKVKHF